LGHCKLGLNHFSSDDCYLLGESFDELIEFAFEKRRALEEERLAFQGRSNLLVWGLGELYVPEVQKGNYYVKNFLDFGGAKLDATHARKHKLEI